MNRFRVNLHPAFFDSLEVTESSEKTDNITEDLKDTKTDIMNDPDFRDMARNVYEEVRYEYSNEQSFRKDLNRFNARVAKYGDKWKEEISKGWGTLLMALNEEGYFEDYTPEKKNKELRKIKEKYVKEVKKQYKKNIWYAKDEKFKAIKDNIFWEESMDYPANKIYCKLTGAGTIIAAGRSYREWYGIDRLVDVEETIDGSTETSIDGDDKYLKRADRNFLSRDLPEYLWNIKGKTVWNIDLGVFSIEEDRTSKIDRKAIKEFLKAAGKIDVRWKDNAIALLEAFRDDRLSARSWKKKYKAVLKAHWIDVSDGNLSSIVRAGAFYISTQRNGLSSRDQHPIYLDVLTIIEEAGWAANAINNNRQKVEEAKLSKKDGTESESLNGVLDMPENKNLKYFAQKLWIRDLARVARLAEKSKDYFIKTPIKNIIANLNNDNELNASDYVIWWQKSWQQFLEILNQLNIKEEDALNNLYERAILENKALWLIDENLIPGKEQVKTQIEAWNKELVLLLQNIISKPGEDLATLLSWRREWQSLADWVSEDKLSEIEAEWKSRKEAFNEAGEILKNVPLDQYKAYFEWKQWVNVSNFADLQASLASCLYDNYKLWLWAWSTLTFKNWAEWLQIWVWAQARDKWGMLGLNIWYDKSFYVWKDWTLTQGLSAWVFLPIVSWSKDALAGAWLNFTADKVTVKTDTWVTHHRWFDAWFNVVTRTVYGWWHENRDKLEWLEEAASYQSDIFEQKIMWSLLDDIKSGLENSDDSKMDLNDPNILNMVKAKIEEKINEQEDIKPGDKQSIEDGMIRMLTVYNNADLSKDGVKYLIAKNIAEQYKLSWIAQRKIDIQNGGVYFSWYSIWGFWKVWTHLVWIYATVSATKQEIDGRWDRYVHQYEQEEDYQDVWTQGLLDSEINTKLRLSGNRALRINEDGTRIIIPASIAHRVKVTEKMKWFIEKDDKWNYLVHPSVVMSVNVPVWSAVTWGELIVGWKKWDNSEHLGRVPEEEYIVQKFEESKISALRESVDKYDMRIIDSALQQLIAKCPNDKQLVDFVAQLTTEQKGNLVDSLNAINNNNKKAKLTIDTDSTWNLKLNDPIMLGDGSWLEIEYKSNSEMISEDVKEIAQNVYTEALNLKDPKFLHEVKHKPWNTWKDFERAYNTLITTGQGENDVKEKIKKIFNYIDGKNRWIHQISNFEGILNSKFDALTGDDLVQALMSIRNIFARSSQVRWKTNKYEFKTRDRKNTMLSIIEQRSGRNGESWILKTLLDNNKIDVEAKQRYRQLFSSVSKYVHWESWFNEHEAQALDLKNTVGFNLWDKANPENPLFDPQIYDPAVDLNKLEEYGFNHTTRESLHQRAMGLFAKNPALVNPILKRLWVGKVDKKILEEAVDKAIKKPDNNNKIEMDADGKCKLTLDINGKIVTINAWMTFWFFTQCVNHTIILNDISWDRNGTTVNYKSSSHGASTVGEGTSQDNTATTVFTVGWAAVVGGDSGNDNWGWADTELWWDGGKWTWEGGDSHLENNHNYNYH